MRWLLYGIAAVAALVVVIAIVGAMLPREHHASRTLTIRRPPEDLWAVVIDRDFAKTAAGDVKTDVVESVPPTRYVTKIADPDQPFGGTWTHIITAVPDGSTLTITEDGWISNVIFRFVGRFIMDHHATMDRYLTNVAKKLNQPVQLSGE